MTQLNNNKANASGGTVAIAGAIVTVVTGLFWQDADPAVVAAITTVLAAVLAYAATWITPATPKETRDLNLEELERIKRNQ